MCARAIILVPIIVVCGCFDNSKAGKGPPPEKLYSPEIYRGDARSYELISEIAATFKNFEAQSQFIQNASRLVIYEGLPHDVHEPELYESERKNAETFEIEGSMFYANPIPIDESGADRLRALSSARTSFVPFQGPKLCGGFHPDWCLAWSNGSETRYAFLCFGCSEMMVRKDGERYLYCDMWDQEQFESILEPLHAHRPKRKPNFE